MALSPGETLGPYLVLAPLGEGGMGEVYRARDTRLDREVALKVLSGALGDSPDARGRFEREARAVAALSHPNILALFDVGESGGVSYAVTELLEGETLRERLAGGPLPWRKALEMACQIARGLAAAHDRGICHRDLKPDNLFLTRDGLVKILDFGLAKIVHQPVAVDTESPTVSQPTEPGRLLGTVGYMSPEQVRGKAADLRSDIFSFGAVLYEMVSGARAFGKDSPAETMSAILQGDPRPLGEMVSGLPAGLERLVAHCLEKVPEDRFQSARDLAFSLEAFSGTPSSPGFGSSPGSPGPTPHGKSSSRLAAGAAAIALLLLGAFLAWAFMRDRKLESPEFQRLTFRRGEVTGAHFMPGGNAVVFSAAWDGGPASLYLNRPGAPESLPIGADATLLAVSPTGELALQLEPRLWNDYHTGTLARFVMGQGSPRQVMENVQDADWIPGGDDMAVTLFGASNQTRLEFPLGKSVLSTPDPLSNPRVSPDGKALALFRNGRIVLVGRDGKERDLAPAPGFLGLAWSHSGKEVWFADLDTVSGGTSLWAAPLAGKRRLLFRTAGALVLCDLGQDGTALTASTHAGEGVVAETQDGQGEHDLTWLNGTQIADLSDDGTLVLLNEVLSGGGPKGSFYLRKVDGSPAVRLGEGYATDMSSDGRWVLATEGQGVSNGIRLVPTGAGEAKAWSLPGLTRVDEAWFLPDGTRLVCVGAVPNGGYGFFVAGLDGSSPRPLGPPGAGHFKGEHPLSPDGKWIAASRGVPGQLEGLLIPVDGGEAKAIPGYLQEDIISGWSGDGKSLYVFRRDRVPASVYKLDLATGERQLWRQLTPADPAGITGVVAVLVTPDEKTLAYQFSRTLQDLYLVKGLK